MKFAGTGYVSKYIKQKMRRKAKSRAKKDELYYQSRAELIAEEAERQGREIPYCQRCNKREFQDCHHKAQKQGVLYWYKPYLSLVCRSCHDAIHSNPSQARAENWIVDLTTAERMKIRDREQHKLYE